jgi:hypothetical protein
MARSIFAAVQQIKSDLTQFLSSDFIQSVCEAVDYSWRKRVLDPLNTVHLFVLQILHGNTAYRESSRTQQSDFFRGD